MDMNRPGRPLRVLQVVNRLDEGEVARYVISLSNQFDRDCFTIGIAALPADPPISPLAPDVSRHLIRLRPGSALGIRRVLLDWPNIWRLRRILQEGEYDLVHTYQAASAVWAWYAARMVGVPVIHTPAPGGWGLKRSERGLFEHDRIRRLSGSHTVRHFIALSDYVYAWLRDTVHQPKNHMTRSWLGVDLEALRPAPPNPAMATRLQVAGSMVIALVGPLVNAQRCALAIDLVAALRRSVPQATLLVTDPGPQRAVLEHAAQAAGQQQRLVIVDPETPIAPLLNLASLALTIDPGPNLSAPLLRVLALAKPLMIIAQQPAELEMSRMVIQRGLNGWALPPDLTVITATLGGILPLTGLLERMGRASRQIAERDFDLRRHAHQIETAYHAVASGQ
jgi:glycosyltransferase involved in cell wall biosynthesis